MSDLQRALLSALLAGIITGGGAFMALLTDAETFSDISGPAYAVAAIAALLSVAKDLQSRLGLEFPRIGPGELKGLGLLAAGLLLTLLLGGCVNQPYRAPQTVYESLLVGNAYGEEVTHTVNDLRRGQVISSAMHQEALDYLQKALDTSRTARAAYQAGNWLEAQAGLDRLESSLRMVALLIQPHLPDDPANQAFIIRYAGGNP